MTVAHRGRAGRWRAPRPGNRRFAAVRAWRTWRGWRSQATRPTVR